MTKGFSHTVLIQEAGLHRLRILRTQVKHLTHFGSPGFIKRLAAADTLFAGSSFPQVENLGRYVITIDVHIPQVIVFLVCARYAINDRHN